MFTKHSIAITHSQVALQSLFLAKNRGSECLLSSGPFHRRYLGCTVNTTLHNTAVNDQSQCVKRRTVFFQHSIYQDGKHEYQQSPNDFVKIVLAPFTSPPSNCLEFVSFRLITKSPGVKLQPEIIQRNNNSLANLIFPNNFLALFRRHQQKWERVRTKFSVGLSFCSSTTFN